MSLADPLDFDLVDPRLHPEPDRCTMWQELRRSRPVAWVAATSSRDGFWAVTRLRDIVAAYRASGELSSASGNMLGTLMHGGDTASGRMLVVTDPPRHTSVRRVLQSGFSARALAPIGDSLLAAARVLVSWAAQQESVDFADAVAAQIPLQAICELLDVPVSDRRYMLELTTAAMGDADESERAAAAAAQRDILLYYAQVLPQRRAVPGEDVISRMVQAMPDGAPMTDAEVLLNCYNMIIGGDETTRLSTVGAVHALAQHPDQWDALVADPSLLDPAVDEVLRWTTPVTHIGRTARSELDLGGARISPGEVVTLWNISANRDEDVFEDPYTFRVNRTANRHVTFGHGPHFCLGGPLAKIEVRAVLQALVEQVQHVECESEPPRLRSTFLTGITHLHASLTPRKAPAHV